MRTFSSPSDVLAAVGDDLEPGPWLEVTQQRVDAFADATGDHQWIHVDVDRAADGPFGGTIAHGYLTLSMLPMLAADVVAYEGCSAVINYGADKVRFPQPLRVGSRVRAGATITAARESGPGVLVTVRWSVEVDGEDKPACVADTLMLLIP
ncbi:MAG: MaoC family dehydratase [Nocardioidaceae bacterium]|nr:MaoC family dehydratase [Nocardioidaceae bacterium]